MALRQNRVWQPREDRVLTLRWGATSLASIAKRLGRSVGAIVHRGRALGLKLSRHGLTSRTGLATRSGYDVRSINAAIRVLALAPSKLPSGGAFSGTGHASRVGLDDDQVDAVLAYLGKRGERREHRRPEGTGYRGRWGVLGRPDACERCDRSDRPYHSKGHCSSCSAQVWRESNPMAARQQRKRFIARRRERLAAPR